MNVVLFQPENPYNTGAVVRTCALLGVQLHLIQPYGFSGLGDDVRRASMSYLDVAPVREHTSWIAFLRTVSTSESRVFVLWDEGSTTHDEVTFAEDDYLVFGRESVGLPPEITSSFTSLRISMPGVAGVSRTDHRDHSLNLSVSVGIAVAEANRQRKV